MLALGQSETVLTGSLALRNARAAEGVATYETARKGNPIKRWEPFLLIAKYFDDLVDISMPDKSNTYSKTQAELVLKDFFTNNPVKKFEIIHKGENAGSQFCIGTLYTKNGSFRTTIFMKQKGGGQLLQELRFENR